MATALERRGFAVLRDQRTNITMNRAPLNLAGIRYWTRQPADIARVVLPSAIPTILLAHDPRRFGQAIELAIAAVLSGHTHGGQVVLPVIGAPAARRFPVVAGCAVRNGTSMFVSRGVGTVYLPLRINCPPEVAVITLRHPTGIA
jgi:predicted MPP superfamily phosphohydrolase